WPSCRRSARPTNPPRATQRFRLSQNHGLVCEHSAPTQPPSQRRQHAERGVFNPKGMGRPRLCCPDGTIENSPAFQRWVGRQNVANPEGTAEDQPTPILQPSLRDLG